jgi:hypothetical protein
MDVDAAISLLLSCFGAKPPSFASHFDAPTGQHMMMCISIFTVAPTKLAAKPLTTPVTCCGNLAVQTAEWALFQLDYTVEACPTNVIAMVNSANIDKALQNFYSFPLQGTERDRKETTREL